MRCLERVALVFCLAYIGTGTVPLQLTIMYIKHFSSLLAGAGDGQLRLFGSFVTVLGSRPHHLAVLR